jgi:hypothetical protein
MTVSRAGDALRGDGYVSSRRKVTVKPGRTKTIQTSGDGKTRVKNGGDEADVRIMLPKS